MDSARGRTPGVDGRPIAGPNPMTNMALPNVSELVVERFSLFLQG